MEEHKEGNSFLESVSLKEDFFKNKTVIENVCMSHSKVIGHRNLDYKPSCRVAHKKQKDEGNAYCSGYRGVPGTDEDIKTEAT